MATTLENRHTPYVPTFNSRSIPMSESFSASVSFEASSAKHLETIKAMFENVDRYETDKVTHLLSKHLLD
jgi:hypothetical protein